MTTVHTVKMPELVASMNVSSVKIVTGFNECAMQVSSTVHCCSDLSNDGKGTQGLETKHLHVPPVDLFCRQLYVAILNSCYLH